MVTVISKDVGEVKDVYKREVEYVKSLEDRNEDYIKLNIGIKE